ncbi:Alpha/beta hydrolase family protein [Rhodococcus rhodochrous J3]|nr:alpha/beta hydrolase [Rhodococcus rhodochrous]TWH63464.1 alpha/beta hydrolase family protein [Rhodococcus rhodochrous J38]SMG09267.1 Alpha/beta hydrolase family protein [Rhodococcus rhodochrous J3]SNV18147.1 Alpha/beta hydrolase family [Rhodococcus rhodochrous]
MHTGVQLSFVLLCGQVSAVSGARWGRIVRMSHSASPVTPTAGTAVVLPGTGSDACFADKAFGAELRRRGITPIAVDPDPRGVVASYLAALDDAAGNGPILVGGVSIGAAVALRWAFDNPDRVVGVLAALPAWTGDPREAPAAASARWTASELREHGLAAVTAAMTASSPPWLARELTRSWSAQWPDLPSALDEAAQYRALDVEELRSVTVPVGIAAAVDDAVHPLEVGQQWAREIPHAELATVTLGQVGDDPSVLGRLCLTALDRIAPVPKR